MIMRKVLAKLSLKVTLQLCETHVGLTTLCGTNFHSIGIWEAYIQPQKLA
jgi:hypothetical protein